MEQVFLNGGLLERTEARVPATDTGILYGSGVFETMRAAGGKVFALDGHLDRMFASGEKLTVHIGYTREFISDAIRRTLQANELTEARIRLTATNGSLDEQGHPQPTLLITAAAFQPYPEQYYQNGVTVVLTDFRQSASDPTCGHKTTSYHSRLLALNIAHQKRAAEALWFTTDNKLAEGSVSNVFLLKKGKLFTPPLSTPVLPGIARKTIIEKAGRRNMAVQECDLFIQDLLEADEVFLTNVVMGVLPVVGVEAHTVGEGKVGPVSKQLYEDWLGALHMLRENT